MLVFIFTNSCDVLPAMLVILSFFRCLLVVGTPWLGIFSLGARELKVLAVAAVASLVVSLARLAALALVALALGVALLPRCLGVSCCGSLISSQAADLVLTQWREGGGAVPPHCVPWSDGSFA